MIPELAALLLAFSLGAALALLLDRTAAGGLFLGEAILTGIGAMASILLLYGLAGVPWSRGLLVGTALVASGPAWWFARHRLPGVTLTRSPLALLLDVTSAVMLFGYATFSTIAPLWEFDYIGDWGLKGRLFFEARGFDWVFLETAIHRATHPDYPVLLPLTFDVLALVRGAWNDRALGLVNVVFALALLLIVRTLAFEETGSCEVAAFITLAMVSFAASPWIGLAEAPLVAFGTAGVLILRNTAESRVAIAAVFLGLAASAKNEGLTLIVAVAIGLLVTGRKRLIPRLWPAIAIPLPWLIVRATHSFVTDLATGSVLSRVIQHLEHPEPLIEALGRYPVGKSIYWIGVILALLVLRKKFFEGEQFAITVIALQMAFYVAAYLASPHDLDWHLRWSWERLVSHLTPTLTFIVLVQLAALVRTERPAPAAAAAGLSGAD